MASKSVKISEKAYQYISDRAKKERRTKTVIIDLMTIESVVVKAKRR